MPKPKLLIDSRMLQDQYAFRGIGRYAKELIRRVIQEKSPTVEIHLCGYGDLGMNLEQLGLPEYTGEVYFHSFRAKGKLTPFSNIREYFLNLLPLVWKLKPDVFWQPHHERGVPPKFLSKSVVMIHDLIPWITNTFSRQNRIFNWLKRQIFRIFLWQANNADVVLTASEFSKQDIGKHTSIRIEKIKSIYQGISEVFTNFDTTYTFSTLEKYGLTNADYLFYDSGQEANKNPGAALDFLEEMLQVFPNLKLVMTGADFIDGEPVTHSGENTYLEAKNRGLLDSLILTGKLSDMEMADVLSGARAYINFSQYEGFGFGPLQAMAMGVPAIISPYSCFPEVSGPGAFMIDPAAWPPEELEKVASLLQDGPERMELIARGKAHAAKFSWERCFEETWAFIEQIMEQK